VRRLASTGHDVTVLAEKCGYADVMEEASTALTCLRATLISSGSGSGR
jgi:hypothetical protein